MKRLQVTITPLVRIDALVVDTRPGLDDVGRSAEDLQQIIRDSLREEVHLQEAGTCPVYHENTVGPGMRQLTLDLDEAALPLLHWWLNHGMDPSVEVSLAGGLSLSEFDCPKCHNGDGHYGTDVGNARDLSTWTGVCAKCGYRWPRTRDDLVMGAKVTVLPPQPKAP